jgi:hypothetical protein
MVDVSKAMESSYITVDLVRESPTKKCIILNEGEYVEAEYQGKKYTKFEFDVEIDKKRKKWSPNKDTVKNISEEYGRDSSNWIGKIIKLSIGKIAGKDTVNGMPIPMDTSSVEKLAPSELSKTRCYYNELV